MARDLPACCTIVMARAPVPGQCKTRLIPALGADGAAALAARMLNRALQQAVAAGLGPVMLSAAPAATHPAFDRWRDLAGLQWADQPAGDLGLRMRAALEAGLTACGRALLIGSDAPSIDAAVLREAAAALLDHDAVFGPTFDGGYALVGLARPLPQLFAPGIAWSTVAVMATTRRRLRECGARYAELAPRHDIDEPADLIHVPAL